MGLRTQSSPFAAEALQAIQGVHMAAYPLSHDEEELARRRETPVAFELRNALLLQEAAAVGGLKMHTGALRQARAGMPPSHHYRDAEHIKDIIRTETSRVQFMGELACNFCPLAGACGIGNTELAQQLRDPTTRRRFVSRLRRPGNTEFCARNLDPTRLVLPKAT
jgi:hypothetical protein